MKFRNWNVFQTIQSKPPPPPHPTPTRLGSLQIWLHTFSDPHPSWIPSLHPLFISRPTLNLRIVSSHYLSLTQFISSLLFLCIQIKIVLQLSWSMGNNCLVNNTVFFIFSKNVDKEVCAKMMTAGMNVLSQWITICKDDIFLHTCSRLEHFVFKENVTPYQLWTYHCDK